MTVMCCRNGLQSGYWLLVRARKNDGDTRRYDVLAGRQPVDVPLVGFQRP